MDEKELEREAPKEEEAAAVTALRSIARAWREDGAYDKYDAAGFIRIAVNALAEMGLPIRPEVRERRPSYGRSAGR